MISLQASAESEKVEFLLSQIADLRAATSSDSNCSSAAHAELQQQLDSALLDLTDRETVVARTKLDLEVLERTIREKDDELVRLRHQVDIISDERDQAKTSTKSAHHVATIERQLGELVEERDKGQQIIKQKNEELEKLKGILQTAGGDIINDELQMKSDISKMESELNDLYVKYPCFVCRRLHFV